MNNNYVIVTPAYNEEANIEAVIKSVIAQTARPLKWVIIDDGSTDKTFEIARRYEKAHDFIECHTRKRIKGYSYFASNVYAILAGYEKVKKLDYDFIAILDGDIELCDNYYQEVFRRFSLNPDLGIATGTYLEEINGVVYEANIDRQSTPKAIQVFRRKCYRQIGGFIPFKNGGEDSCAEVMARMFGWRTWSFPEIKVLHQRPVGTGEGHSILHGRYRLGLTDYCLGTHPLFMFAKCLRRCFVEKPYIFSGLCRIAGYVSGYIMAEPRQIPYSARSYLRKEQIRRLNTAFGLKRRSWSPVLPVEVEE